MQFFHVSITFVAQKLVDAAQIEKKWILSLLSIRAKSLVFSSLKKALFFKNFKISFWRIRLENQSKSVQMSNILYSPTYTYQMACFDILVGFQHHGSLEINSGLFFEKTQKNRNFFIFRKSIFFQPNAKKSVLGLRE